MLRKIVERMNICILNQEEHIINTIDNLSCSFMKKKLFYLEKDMVLKYKKVEII